MNDFTKGKATNPKEDEALPKGKAPLALIPPAILIDTAEALRHGAVKYGRYNWRESGVRSSVYISAILRHLYAWSEGEDLDRDSGCSHLGHVVACCSILADAMAIDHGLFVDDRVPGPFAEKITKDE